MTLPLCSIETGSPAWLSFIKSLLQNDDFAAPISHDGPSLADGGSPRRAIHGRSSCQRHPVVTDRAIAAARQTATPPLSWPEAVASAQSPHRHSLRIENRHCLERSAMRNGLRLGRYLLALSSCLEPGGRVAVLPSSVARRTSRGGSDRLVARRRGQRLAACVGGRRKNRPKSHGSAQTGKQAPCGHRWPRHPFGEHAERRQPARCH